MDKLLHPHKVWDQIAHLCLHAMSGHGQVIIYQRKRWMQLFIRTLILVRLLVWDIFCLKKLFPNDILSPGENERCCPCTASISNAKTLQQKIPTPLYLLIFFLENGIPDGFSSTTENDHSPDAYVAGRLFNDLCWGQLHVFYDLPECPPSSIRYQAGGG